MEVKKGIYQHYKGKEKLYRVIGIAVDCEDLNKKVVVYEQLYETDDFPKATIWFRDLDDFCAVVKLENGEEVLRFKFISEDDGRGTN